VSPSANGSQLRPQKERARRLAFNQDDGRERDFGPPSKVHKMLCALMAA
jgi:hypothetical protein